MQGNTLVCTSCLLHQAESFCICTDPSTLLCGQCLDAHHQKNKTGQHLTYPIAALQHAKEPNYLVNLLHRIGFFAQIRKQTEHNLAEIEKCTQEFVAKTEELIHMLVTQSKEVTASLRQRSREIEASLAEVEATLTEQHPQLQTPYGAIMREHLDCKSADFELFYYEIDVPQPQSLISLRAGNEVKCLCGIKMFPCISGKKFHLYNFEMELCHSVELSVTFTEGSVFCLLDRRTVLGVGGSPASTEVYLMDFVTFEVHYKPSLISARAFSGIVKEASSVYVFGGCNPDLSTCEKLGNKDLVWSACGDMSRSRSYFAPCAHQQIIYLADYRSIFAGLIELFSTETQTFSILRLNIRCERPIHSHKSSDPAFGKYKTATLFLVDETLWVLVEDQVGKWNIASTDQFQIMAVSGQVSQRNSSALIRGNKAFIAGSDGELYMFDSQTCTVKSRSPSSSVHLPMMSAPKSSPPVRIISD